MYTGFWRRNIFESALSKHERDARITLRWMFRKWVGKPMKLWMEFNLQGLLSDSLVFVRKCLL